MGVLDNFLFPTKDFAYSTVATAPSPDTSGTSLVVAAGEGVKFPVPTTDGAFRAYVYPATQRPDTTNCEEIEVTAVSTDTFTIVRAKNGVSRAITVGDRISINYGKSKEDQILTVLKDGYVEDKLLPGDSYSRDSTIQFKTPGDKTGFYTQDRVIRVWNSSVFSYHRVVSSSYSALYTTVIVKDAPLPATLTNIYIALHAKGYIEKKDIFVAPQGSASDWDTDVANIRAAIAAGGNIKLGAGDFYLNTTDAAIFTITSSKHIIGSGEQQTYLILKDGLGATIDLFNIDCADVTEDIDIGHFTIRSQNYGTARGRHMFNINKTLTSKLIWSRFHNIVFPIQGDINGNDFYHYNNSGLYKFGNSEIDHNYIRSGIKCTQLGDDLNVFSNHFEGNNIGCEIVSMVDGAVNFYFFRNSAQVSNIVLSFNGLGAHIFQNGLEVIGGTPLAVIYLNGGWLEGGLFDWRASIIDNKQIYAYPNTHAHAIYLVGEKNTVIEGNYLCADNSATTYKDLYVDSGCLNIRVNRNNYFVNQQVSDTGGKIKVVGLASGETGLF